MLKSPQRNANDSASAQQMIGVVIRSVCWRFAAAGDAVSHQNHTCSVENGSRTEYEPKWKKKFSPVPS